MKLIQFICTLSLITAISCSGQTISTDRNWPMYRGNSASGVLDNADIPDSFDMKSGTNVKWTLDLPGLGLSSPVIWGDKLFITTAVSQEDKGGLKTGIYGDIAPVQDTSVHEWKVFCLDKKSGNILWERTSFVGVPKIKRHSKSSHANSSVATDGKFAVAFFGSEGLYCYDMEGKLIWKKDFGKLESVFFAAKSAEWEFASSPIIHKGVVIVQVDVMNNSFVAAFEAKSGKQLWKTERDEWPGWSTPNIYSHGGRDIVVLNGYKHRGAYDFLTGEEVWKMAGGGDIPIPTPVFGKDVIFFNSAHGKLSPVYAVKKSATGDITLAEGETTNAHIKWSVTRGGSYMQTLLLNGDYLYNLNWNGNLHCFNAATGEELYREKLGQTRSFTASPVASDGRIYLVDDEGTVYVVRAGPTFELISTSELGGVSMTAPAITDGIIFFRTVDKLVAVGK